MKDFDPKRIQSYREGKIDFLKLSKDERESELIRQREECPTEEDKALFDEVRSLGWFPEWIIDGKAYIKDAFR